MPFQACSPDCMVDIQFPKAYCEIPVSRNRELTIRGRSYASHIIRHACCVGSAKPAYFEARTNVPYTTGPVQTSCRQHVTTVGRKSDPPDFLLCPKNLLIFCPVSALHRRTIPSSASSEDNRLCSETAKSSTSTLSSSCWTSFPF